MFDVLFRPMSDIQIAFMSGLVVGIWLAVGVRRLARMAARANG
jgi:hypothetical protein